MNVLTIDLDYMSTNYSKLVDSVYSNDFTNKRWGEFYKNTYYSEDHFKINIDNWLFILDVYNVWLPEHRSLMPGDNIYKTFPNLYTIRGTTHRDVIGWVSSLDKMRSHEPEYIFPSHTKPIIGSEEAMEALTI